MTSEEYIELLNEELQIIKSNYINKGRVNSGGTALQMLERAEKSIDDIDVLEKDLLLVVNRIINDNNVEVSDELHEEIQKTCMSVLKSIINYRLFGVE